MASAQTNGLDHLSSDELMAEWDKAAAQVEKSRDYARKLAKEAEARQIGPYAPPETSTDEDLTQSVEA